MKSTLALLALVASSQALVARDNANACTMEENSLVARDSPCCFGITAYGGPGGQVGQLSDGQNRIGNTSLPLGRYCIDSNGGFSIGCNGTISHNGETDFFACPTGMNGGYNIYAKPLIGEPSCEPLWLNADSCHKNCVKTSTITAPCTTSTPPLPPPQTTAVPPPPPPAQPTCPATLSGNWEFPHLIVPVNAADANKAYGTSYNSTASGSISSIFNFDIPSSYAGKTCSLEFLFPTQDQLETSAYEFSGAGTFEFSILAGVATQDTTYANAPKPAYSFGSFSIQPGTATYIGSCPDGCPAGKAVSFYMRPVGDSSLNYFQDSNPCPIGLYVTAI